MATPEQKTGTAALLSIISVVISVVLTFMGHPIWALLLALVGILLGIIGLLSAASPRVSGGVLSIAAIILGVLALGLSVLGMIGVALF